MNKHTSAVEMRHTLPVSLLISAAEASEQIPSATSDSSLFGDIQTGDITVDYTRCESQVRSWSRPGTYARRLKRPNCGLCLCAGGLRLPLNYCLLASTQATL